MRMHEMSTPSWRCSHPLRPLYLLLRRVPSLGPVRDHPHVLAQHRIYIPQTATKT